MRNLIQKALHSTLLLTVLVMGCSSAGSEYVGKWVNANNSADTMDITRNGDRFQITGATLEKIDATYAKGGTLQIPGPMGTGLSLTYNKSSDTLQGPGMFAPTVYKRVK
jgi:hypothetical protein